MQRNIAISPSRPRPGASRRGKLAIVQWSIAALAATAVALALTSPLAQADVPSVVRIGVLNDMSGPYADLSGPGSVVAAQLAADDFMKESPPFRVEILFADHQNKADVGSAIVRRWLDVDGVAAVVDVPKSAVALAVTDILRQRDRTVLASSVATSDLTGPACAPTTVQWTMDTWAVGHGTARPLLDSGGKSWTFIASDYALGKSLERDTLATLAADGGRSFGTSFVPLGATDYSAQILRAQASGAQVIALAMAGNDATNAIKQAAEFGIGRAGDSQRLAGLLIFTTDIDALGLDAAQGLLLTEAFYWDLNDATRAWSQRFAAGHKGRMPTANHAGVYSATLAYLRAVRAAGTISGTEVVAQMRAAPMDDALFGRAVLRVDGRVTHPMYLFRVKIPAASRGRWDYYDVVATIPAEQAFRPLDQSCPLVRAAAPGAVR